MRKWIAGGTCTSQGRLDGKTVLITGANTGIGKETAQDMAQRGMRDHLELIQLLTCSVVMLLCAISGVCIQGARVVMACRDLVRADMAAQAIRQATGNGNVVTRHLNLASIYSIREFAKEYLATEERLDILINNAGKS